MRDKELLNEVVERQPHYYKPPTDHQKFRKPRTLKELPKGSKDKDPFFLVGEDLKVLIVNHIYIEQILITFQSFLYIDVVITYEQFVYYVEESGLDIVYSVLNDDVSIGVECSFKEKDMIDEDDNQDYIDLELAKTDIISTIEDCVRVQFYFDIVVGFAENEFEDPRKQATIFTRIEPWTKMKMVCFFFCTTS